MKRQGEGWLRAVAVLALVSMLVGACSSKGGGGATGGQMKVGLLLDLTGELGSFGKPWQQALELARDDINSTGGLPGNAKIVTVVEDEKTDPQIAVQAARRMIDVQHVSAIIGPTSGPMVALVPLAKRSRVPMISEAAGTVALNQLGGDFVYRTVASDNADGLAAAQFLSDQAASSVAVVFQNEESPASVGSTFKQEFTSKGGTVATTVALNPAQTSYQAEARRVLSANPQWIFCACGQQSGVTFLKNLRSGGYSGKILVSADLVVPEVIKAAGADIMAGVYGEGAASDTSLPAYQTFAQQFKSKYGTDPGLFTANAYDAMVLAALAVVKAGSTDGAAINGALRDVASPPGTVVHSYAEGVRALKAGEDINYDGASGPLDFDQSGTVTSAYAISQVKSGDWKQVQFYPATTFSKTQ